jgi:hypothetical protein
MKWNKILFFLLSGIILAAPFGTTNAGSGWLVFHEKSFKGKIIDVETKEPIEGAVVVAQYHVNMLGPTGSHTTLIDVQEVLTDKNGDFILPSLTKLINPISTGDDTSFLIWKPGFKKEDIWGGYFFSKEPGTVENRPVHAEGGLVLRPVRLGIVELGKVRTREERRVAKPGPVGDEPEWRKQKQFIKMIREEWEFLYGEPARDLYKIKEGN